MFCKTMQIVVILWCLVLAFETADAQNSRNGANNSDESIDRISYRLPNDTKPENYKISLRMGNSEDQRDYNGSISINISIVNATRAVTIHARELDIKSIRLSNETGPIALLPWRIDNITDFLTIPTKNVELLRGSRYRLGIEFAGQLKTNLEGFFVSPDTSEGWIAATRFRPIYARTAFPCYDEPRFKTNVTIDITHNANYSAVSNMPGTRSESLDGVVITRFATTPAIPIYLVAFAITGVDRTQTLPIECEKVLKSLESHLQVPYVTPKMDPVFFPGSVEVLSQIPIRNTTLIDLDSLVLAHEVIYQWLEYIAPPKWWSYKWLNDGLAGYFAHLAFGSLYPEQKKFDVFNYILHESLQSDVKELPPLMKYSEDPQSVRDMFLPGIALKSPFVVRMMWEALTEASFKKGLTNFLTRSAYNVDGVDEDDLFVALDRAAKEDGTLPPELSVKEIFSSWSHQAGFPMLTVTRNYENGSITISQQRCSQDASDNLKQNDSTTWWIPYNFATAESPLFSSTRPIGWLPQHQRSKLIEPSSNESWAPTDWVLFNKQQMGYYRVLYDIPNWELLIAELRSGPNNRIHRANRDQLCDDLTFFVMTRRLPMSLLLGMFEYLNTVSESEYTPRMADSALTALFLLPL